MNRKINRKQSKLKQGPSVNGVIILLESCREWIRYNSLFRKSKIYFKKSFTSYLKWCLKMKFILNTKTIGKKGTTIESIFCITKRGREFLELVGDKNE